MIKRSSGGSLYGSPPCWPQAMIESFIKYDELCCRPRKQLKGENVEVPLFGANDKKFATIAEEESGSLIGESPYSRVQ